MEILNYGKKVVCFRDYETTSGARIFLEVEVEPIGGTHSVHLISKYDHISEMANATATFDGTALTIRDFSSHPKIKTFEAMRTQLSDMENILTDPIIVREIGLKTRFN